MVLPHLWCTLHIIPTAMTPLVRLLYFLLALVTASTTAQVPTGKDAVLHIKHSIDFQVIGDGGTTPWQTTDWITLPQRKGTLLYNTTIKLLYSTKGIYVLFNCEDKKITATKKEDFTDLWRQDVVEIFFWTDEAVPLYFEYELSPLNHELALLVPNLNGEFLGWRPWQYEGDRKVQHAVKILKEGKQDITSWRAEFFIPYILLKPLQNVPPKKGTQWRINMYRLDYDESAPTSWAWQPTNTNFHDHTSYGTLEFD
jgi:hypothetical protein